MNCSAMNDTEKNTCSQNDTEKEVIDKDFKISAWGVRHGQCVLLFFTLTIAYSMRACMGVALVAMVNESPTLNQNITKELFVSSNFSSFNLTDDTLNYTVVNATTLETDDVTENVDENEFKVNGFFNAILFTPPFPRFAWTKKIQDTVLSSFFWGYMILQLPAGQLAHRFGAKYLLVGALTANCLIAFIFPVVSYYGGWTCASTCRFVQGLTQACIIPSFHTILGKWSPLEERGRMSGIIYGGQALGTVLGLPLTGYVASSPLGWPGVFRFYGLLLGIMGVILWRLLADTPAQHKTVSPGERRYIEEALGQMGPKKKLPIPWKKILGNPGMLSIIAAHIGNTWGQLILYSEVPSYMAHVMGVDIKANGLLTALPFFCMWIINFFFSWFADMLVVKKYLTVTKTRKFMNSLGSIIASIGLIALGYSSNNIYVVEAMLIIICSFKVATHFGFYVNHVDIAPNYAGTMMSISNFCSNLVGSQAPLIAGAILTDVTDASQWRIIFFITAALYFFTNLIYLAFGTSELADWNDPPQYEKVDLSECEGNLTNNENHDDKKDNETT